MKKNELMIYKTASGELQLKGDVKKQEIWASLDQIAVLFGRDNSVISRHIKNIFKEEELFEKSVVAIFATTAADGKTYNVKYYNLDLIISVGYRVNSKIATKFRQWATKILKQHMVEGYTINKKQISKNYDKFLQAVDAVKLLLPQATKLKSADALELVKLFANTWFSLGAYDKTDLPRVGLSRKQVKITADD